MSCRGKAVLIAVAALMLGGCVVVERSSLEIRIHPDRSASYQAEYYNVQSDAQSADGRQRDFRELLELWRGDKYLLDALAGGRYVRTRELVVERGVVVGREAGLFWVADRNEFPPLLRSPDGGLRMRIDPGDSLISSNGAWLPDSGQVIWPAGASELKVTMRGRDFAPTAGFAAWLQREKSRR